MVARILATFMTVSSPCGSRRRTAHSVRVNASTGSSRGLLRVGLVVLLVVAAFFAALPWLGCISSIRAGFYAIPNVSLMLGFCTFGFGVPNPPGFEVPGFTGPYWGNLIIGVVYLIAAIYAALTKRAL